MNINNDSESIRPMVESMLSSGERLYWTGRPNPLRSMRSNLMQPLFGLVWIGMVFFMFTKFNSFGSSFRSSSNSFATAFQLILGVFFLVGLGMILSPAWNYLKARFTVYALTDERAMIIKQIPSQSVQSYSVRNIQKVIRRGSDSQGDVIFGSETHTYTEHNTNQGGININFSESGTNVNLNGATQTRTVTVSIGFFGISQPREVEALFLDMIKRARDT